ncbi:exopolysaccharide biosynthesis polyprenyl glycosylphosphotransferase [Aggregatimonas sangjinii]|uniref:Exopolysaccharide biosynthesis polyprenyl glycosylphosphotransferase n=1 Tax=Aggregatimonas sangjinii TaxID=2583587 RepID=A0A5B7SSL4_9FLAO|nr:exopolysaccharide biosynthesis polyprenyl glycosylphosphotransferase [Aggregatimonas sangjinii]QCX01666.1 exopolysaccharide biosynthesis polyprenyl glycosylphosphotransferase [Aggregatimonas sangjinii]
MNSKNRFILINLLAYEFVLLNLVLIVYVLIRHPELSLYNSTSLLNIGFLVIIYNVSWLLIISFIRDNDFYFNTGYNSLKSLINCLFFFVGFVITLIILLRIDFLNRSTFIAPIFIFSYVNLVSRKYILKYLKKKGAHFFSNVLIVGLNYNPSRLRKFSDVVAQYGYNTMGYLDADKDEIENESNLSIVGNLNTLSFVLSENDIDEVFIASAGLKQDNIEETIGICDSFGVRVKLMPSNPLLMSKNCKAFVIGDMALYRLRQSKLDSYSQNLLKRIFDVCFSFSALVLGFPIFLLVAVLIYLESGGPIFYTPLRKGEAGRTFRCYKFRTMRVCEDPVNGTKSTVVNDPRITRVGKVLRKIDFDELPQFWNVLKGEMSVVGPRPHRIKLQDTFRKSVNDYMVRSYVKPGISGWAQVNGWRGPTVTKEQKNERVRHDLWYIENWNFWLDIKIIFLTVFGNHHKKAF